LKNARPRRPSAALVIACIALFVALGGASYAAVNLPKNSVGAKQIKKNAVKTNKLAAKAVKAGKIAKNAITTNRLRSNAVTGAKIKASSTPFGQIVQTLSGSGPAAFEKEVSVYPLSSSTYTQPAGRLDQYFGAIDISFSAGCEAPRSAAAFLLVDAANPKEPLSQNYAGYTVVQDNGAGEVSTRTDFGPFPGVGANYRSAPAADTPHTFSVLLAGSSCKSGSGVTATGASINVVGTK